MKRTQHLLRAGPAIHSNAQQVGSQNGRKLLWTLYWIVSESKLNATMNLGGISLRNRWLSLLLPNCCCDECGMVFADWCHESTAIHFQQITERVSQKQDEHTIRAYLKKAVHPFLHAACRGNDFIFSDICVALPNLLVFLTDVADCARTQSAGQ